MKGQWSCWAEHAHVDSVPRTCSYGPRSLGRGPFWSRSVSALDRLLEQHSRFCLIFLHASRPVSVPVFESLPFSVKHKFGFLHIRPKTNPKKCALTTNQSKSWSIKSTVLAADARTLLVFMQMVTMPFWCLLRGTDTLRTLFSCLFFKNHSKIVRARECTRSKWSLISLHQQYLRKLFHQIPVTHARTNDRCRQNGAHFASNGTASQRLTRFSWLKVFQVAKWKRGNF